jgi:hypothetical protein
MRSTADDSGHRRTSQQTGENCNWKCNWVKTSPWIPDRRAQHGPAGNDSYKSCRAGRTNAGTRHIQCDISGV